MLFWLIDGIRNCWSLHTIEVRRVYHVYLASTIFLHSYNIIIRSQFMTKQQIHFHVKLTEKSRSTENILIFSPLSSVSCIFMNSRIYESINAEKELFPGKLFNNLMDNNLNSFLFIQLKYNFIWFLFSTLCYLSANQISLIITIK